MSQIAARVSQRVESWRKERNEKMTELEVVGYGSKLFRDETAAQYCHDEKQLHPHELDPYCTIDRFVDKKFFQILQLCFKILKNCLGRLKFSSQYLSLFQKYFTASLIL